MTLSIDDLPALGPVIPVIVLHRREHAVPMARALVDGGVRVLEVTLRTPVALDAIADIARDVPEAVVGAGTLRTAADVTRVRDAGARFAVSPGYSTALARSCREHDLPLLPGVATASEVMAAAEAGLRFLKLFPAGAVGGVELLRAFAGPFAEIGFCPTGGVSAANAPDYLKLPNVRCVGGSWLAPTDALERHDWAHIRALAAQAMQLRPAAQPGAA